MIPHHWEKRVAVRTSHRTEYSDCRTFPRESLLDPVTLAVLGREVSLNLEQMSLFLFEPMQEQGRRWLHPSCSVWVRDLGTKQEAGKMKLLVLHQALLCWIGRVQC